MKNKKLLITMFTTMLCCSFLLTSAWAGAEQRYRWEGIAIGIGAAVLGNALFNACCYSQPGPAPVCYSPPPVVYYSPGPPCFTPPVAYYSKTVIRSGPPPWRRYGHWEPRHRFAHRRW